MNTDRRRCSNSNLKPGQKPELPAWQLERANRLHRQFKRAETALQRGKSLNAALYQFQYFWRGENYRSDYTKPVRFSLQTLRRLFYHWRKNGCVPAALRLRFTANRPTIPAPVLLRFLAFVAATSWPSMKAAWSAFSNKPGAFARGRKAGKRRVQFSYGTVCRHFPVANFRAIQAQLIARDNAIMELARLRAQFTAEVRRLPDRPQRTRRNRAEISLEASAL